MPCLPEHMRWAYRLLLDREVESEDVLKQSSRFADAEALRGWLMSSDEFILKNSKLVVELYDRVNTLKKS